MARLRVRIAVANGVYRDRSDLVGCTSTDPGVARSWYTLQRGSIAVPAYRSC
jgi:hypothetical protein